MISAANIESRLWGNKAQITWYYIIMVFFSIVFFTMAIANHYFFRTVAFDYGLYNFAFRDYAHFHVSKCPIYNYQDMSLMQDHFSLTLWYLIPFYWLLNWLTGTYTLMLIQSAMLVIGGWAVYRFIKLKTADGWLANGALLYYFLLQGHYSIFAGDCNITVIGSCFVPLFLLYFERKQFWKATLFFVFALVAKENMAIWLIFLFPILIYWHRKEKHIIFICLGFIALSLLYFVAVFNLFIPSLHANSSTYNLFNYSALGETPGKALQFVFGYPAKTFQLLFDPGTDPLYKDVKLEFYIVYLVSGGFMLFYRPQYFIWFLPLIAQKMLNDMPVRWSIQWHYTIEIATILPIAVFMILANEKVLKWRYGLAVMICVCTYLMTSYKMDATNRKMPWISTLKENITDPNFFKSDYNISAINKALAKIPANAHVSASQSLLPHLADRQYIYEFPKVDDADYIAVFNFRDYFEVSSSDYQVALVNYLLNPDWSVIAHADAFYLFKRGHSNTSENIGVSDTTYCNVETLTEDKQYMIGTNGRLFYNPIWTQNDEKAHSGKYSVKLNKDQSYGLTFSPKDYLPGDMVKASVWEYTTDTNASGTLALTSGKDFYAGEKNPGERDGKGWKLLSLSCVIPSDTTRLRVFVWNTSGGTVWFDDLTVRHLRLNPHTGKH